MNARLVLLSAAVIVAIAACGGSCGHEDPTPSAATWHAVLTGEKAPLLSAWEAPDHVLFVVGGSAHGPIVLRHDRDGWWEMDPGVEVPLWWVFGFSSTDVYAVGERGTVTHFDGVRWTQQLGGDARTLYGGWGATREELWAVGGAPSLAQRGPFVLRHRGSGWEPVEFPSSGAADDPGNLFKVFGSAADDAWLVGEDGLAAHWDGAALSRVTMPVKEILVTGVSVARDRAYVVGGQGRPVVLRWDGAAWTREPVEDDQGRGLFGVAVSGDRVVVGGERGLLLESIDGGGLVPANVEGALTDTLHAIASAQGGFIAVGGNLESTADRGVLYANVELASEPRHVWTVPGVPLDAGADDAGTDAGMQSEDGGDDAGDDAGVADAGDDGGFDAGDDGGLDAGDVDAGESDAGVDAGLDAGTDAGFGPGEDCGQNFSGCAAPDSCWYIFNSMKAVCTRTCLTAADCGDFGPNACCDLPGPQSVTPTCIPSGMNGVKPCP